MSPQNYYVYPSIPGQPGKDDTKNKIRYSLKLSLPEKIIFLNLSADSNELLMTICNEAIILDYPLVSLKNIINKVHIKTIPELKACEAFLDLIKNGYIELLTPDILGNDRNGDIIHISNYGLERFFQIFFKNYEVIKKSVIEFILLNASVHNSEMLKSEIISKMLKQQKIVINTILECLEYKGKISLVRSFGENWIVKKINHEMFRRVIKNL